MNKEPNYLGKYKIVQNLGSGSSGIVYKVIDNEIGRAYALKTIRPEKVINANLDEIKKHFRREVKAVQNLSHPNIVRIFEYGEYENIPFILMEYIRGDNLEKILKNDKPSINASIFIAIEILKGVFHAHSHRIIHRDIKPSNVIISESGQVKITDFGTAKIPPSLLSDSLISDSNEILGTPGYFTPEQAKGEILDHRSDIFSVGVVLYEMLAGENPFYDNLASRSLYKVSYQYQKSLSSIDPNIPKRLEQITNKALEKEANTRYQSAKDMLNDLENMI